MRRPIATLLLLALAAAPAAADVVHLTDGRTLVGKVNRAGGDQWAVTTTDHRVTLVSADQLASIDLTARPTTDPVAVGRRLDAVRRAAARADDPAHAIALYAHFAADPAADPATLAVARQDLAVWQDRADRHLVRLNGRWVQPAARDQALADALVYAGEARQLLKQGRFPDAEPVLAAALAINPQDVSALYLQGLTRLQQNQLPAARAAFEAVAALVPDHAPTRVNLAVVAWRLGRYADALARYDQAMILAPANPAVLADVSAALAAGPPPTLARSPSVAPLLARVTQRYRAQQKQMAERMSQLGLHPFGATWLSDDELAGVRRGQQQDRVTLDALTAAFERAQDRVRQIDLAIAEVEVQARRSAAVPPGPLLASYDGTDGSPSTVAYDLRNDADQLRVRRAKAVIQLDDLHRQAVAIRQRMTGEINPVQRPVGPEGTPVRPPPSPSTASPR